ncbi:MAG: hypothetical protein KAX49_03835 [Halanaerobiales bacterium]|nr:hypothetical protein [Halanaerobiales bacterium]
MAKLNNQSFHLQEYTYSSNMGNKGIKLASTNKNIVLNLGKEIATIDLTALLSNQSDFNMFKREFSKGELSTLEINEEMNYLAYPDTIILRRRGGDALLGDFNSWRVAEMSFLLPDSTIYGDLNCTSYHLPPGSPSEGTLKEISIGGSEETPMSISLHSYNISSGGYQASGAEEEVTFGQPDCLFVPDDDKCTVYYLRCNHAKTVDGGITVYGGYGLTLPPISFPSNESYEWVKANKDLFQDYIESKNNIESYELLEWYKWVHAESAACRTRWNLYFKIDVEAKTTGIYPFRGDLEGKYTLTPGEFGGYWPMSPPAKYIYRFDFESWENLELPRSGAESWEVLSRNISSNGIVNYLYHLGYEEWYEACWEAGCTLPHGCPNHEVKDVGISYMDFRKFRHPQYLLHYPSSDISFVNALLMNGSVVNPASDKIVMETWGSDADANLIELLGSKEIDEGDWKSDVLLPLAVDTGSYDYTIFKFSSQKVEIYKDWKKTTTALINDSAVPEYNLGIQPLNLGGNLPYCWGKQSFNRFSWEIDSKYDEHSNYGLKQLFFKQTLSKFEVWNRLDPEMKLSLNGALLGSYSAEYLKNFDFSFKDEYAHDNFLLASQDATVSGGHVVIGTNGYIYYNFNFGIPLIDNPTLLMKYSQAPSSMKLIDDKGAEYEARVPNNDILEELYCVTYPLISHDNCVLKINGPADISEFNIYGKGSGYLFSTPYLQANTNNIIEYRVSGIYDNISGDLCWREAG